MHQNVKSIACVGEVMIELIVSDARQARIGVAGDTYNTAVYLSHLLGETDASISYVTALGYDRYSGLILDEMATHKLDQSCIERREGMLPGLYAIDIDDKGERSFSYWRSNSAAKTLFNTPGAVDLDRLGAFDMVYLSGITLAILSDNARARLLDWMAAYRRQGGLIAFDSNFRPALWANKQTAQASIKAAWEQADIALPSVDDEMTLFEDQDAASAFSRIVGYGASFGALKRGAEGPIDLASKQTPSGLGSVKTVVDTTAAGDSFNAGYIAALVQGKSSLEAARAGHNLAACVIANHGAIVTECIPHPGSA